MKFNKLKRADDVLLFGVLSEQCKQLANILWSYFNGTTQTYTYMSLLHGGNYSVDWKSFMAPLIVNVRCHIYVIRMRNSTYCTYVFHYIIYPNAFIIACYNIVYYLLRIMLLESEDYMFYMCIFSKIWLLELLNI